MPAIREDRAESIADGITLRAESLAIQVEDGADYRKNIDQIIPEEVEKERETLGLSYNDRFSEMHKFGSTKEVSPSREMTCLNDISRITGNQKMLFGSSLPSEVYDEGKDSNLWNFLKENNLGSDIELVDMGQIEEEDRPFMIVDKDTGNVYDSRNKSHVNRLTDNTTVRLST